MMDDALMGLMAMQQHAQMKAEKEKAAKEAEEAAAAQVVEEPV